MAQRTAAQRREARRRKRIHPDGPPGGHGSHDWEIREVASGPLLGPDVRSASLEELRAAVSGLPGGLPWEEIASSILPLFERVRPLPPGFPDHLVTIVPPGVPISLGIDVGPAFAYVTTSMVDAWSMSSADVTARAIANLHARAVQVEPSQIVRGAIDGVETGWLQTDLGIGSTLVLAPQELARLFGSGPTLFVAPMRDLLISLPPDEDELAMWLFAEIASQDPNHLRPRFFRFDGRMVRVQATGP